MTSTLQRVEGPGDAELIAAVRGGDNEAYGLLFERHVDAARRLARQLVRGSDADDLVSEAFAKVLTVLQRGDGPDLAFRAYLLTAVRRLHIDKVRSASRLHTTDDLTPFDPGVPFHDTVTEGFENDAAARAFASLPERWQMVLWHTSVEGQKPAEVAVLLGMSANSVAALAYRAREGLRQAYLTMHVAEREDDTCEWVHQNLGGYLRGGISRRDTAKVEAHLEECRPCLAIYLELTEVNSNLAAWLAPAVLGAAAAGYLAAGSGSIGAGVLVVGLLDRAKDVVAGHTLASTAAGVAATVVIGGAVVVGTTPDDVRLAGDPPPGKAGDQVVEPKTEAAGPGPGRDRERSERTRERQQRPGRTLSVAGPADDLPSAAPETDDPSEPGDDPTTPGVVLPEDPGTTPPDDGEEPTPEPVEDVRLVVDTQPREGSATPVSVTVVGLTGDQGGDLSVTWEGLETVTNPSDDCQGSPLSSWACAASAAGATFRFGAQSNEPGTVTFTVTVPDGTDADPSNNSVTIQVAGNG
jgi:RNA polymerase sigma factor (sigma-70 family)